ncbi:MAG: (d)CMP kinase [Planctomycetota bacterium]
MIITIDGPAGSGKSTTARKLAARLGVPYLDTGAMYRVITLAALNDGIDLNDDVRLSALAGSEQYQLDLGPTHIRVTLRGSDVTEEIRSMRVNEHTRYIAALPGVRAGLVEKQRQIGQQLGTLVTEGRDQGSVAFPDAEVKFFLDANIETRAQRRLHDLLADGEDVTIEQVIENLSIRDQTDTQRNVGPLTIPAGAIQIDTSHMSISRVLDRMVAHLEAAGLARNGKLLHATTGD